MNLMRSMAEGIYKPKIDNFIIQWKNRNGIEGRALTHDEGIRCQDEWMESEEYNVIMDDRREQAAAIKRGGLRGV
jgi:hypothetical protein